MCKMQEVGGWYDVINKFVSRYNITYFPRMHLSK